MDRSPVLALLPNGKTTEFTLEHLYEATWGTHATPDFWEWFNTLNANAGDHLGLAHAIGMLLELLDAQFSFSELLGSILCHSV